MKADLSRKATLGSMSRLGIAARAEVERAGKEPTSKPARFEGRDGFDPSFLDGWEMPIPIPVEDVRKIRYGGTGAELKYQNFSVVMSASRRLPMLTAANIDGTQARKVARSDVWRYDGRLDKEDQWGDELYDGNLLDRGHMVRREDPVWGTLDEATVANEDSFHFTNSCPQMGAMNQKTWLGLEDYVLKNARADGMRVNVFTGPVFTAEDPDYRGALIPRSFWKIVAIVTEDGRPSATAYIVTQDKELAALEYVYAGYKTYQVSISYVMDQTGLDFTALLPYDAFSAYESASGQLMREQLDSLEQVRA